VTAASKGELARQVLGVEAIDSENGWHSLFAEAGNLPPTQMKWLDGASLIFSFVSQLDDIWSRNVQRLSPTAKIIYLQPRPPIEYSSHATQFLIEQLSDVPVIQQGVQQIVSGLAQRPIKSLSLSRQRIVIHPGAGALDKCWAAENYLELISRLCEQEKPVRILLGEVERERWSADQIAQFQTAAEIVWPATYVDLLTELREASIFIGNDSGPSHLAGMIGVPTLVIFKASNPDQWRPLGPMVRIAANPAASGKIVELLNEMQKSQNAPPRMAINEQE
jgi:ADP-heptose:LPS heptosyltransferase